MSKSKKKTLNALHSQNVEYIALQMEITAAARILKEIILIHSCE